jgi:hypothetical protein
MNFLTLTAESLEKQGISCGGASQIVFNRKTLIRSIDFATHARLAAIKFCGEYLEDKLDCLLVEGKLYLTVWVEKENTNSAGKTATQTPNYGSAKSNNSYKRESKSGNLAPEEQVSTNFIHSRVPSLKNVQVLAEKNSLLNSPSSVEELNNSELQAPEVENQSDPPSSPSSSNPGISDKKRSKRKYRGISY